MGVRVMWCVCLSFPLWNLFVNDDDDDDDCMIGEISATIWCMCFLCTLCEGFSVCFVYITLEV